jgi:hypothetical protein
LKQLVYGCVAKQRVWNKGIWIDNLALVRVAEVAPPEQEAVYNQSCGTMNAEL